MAAQIFSLARLPDRRATVVRADAQPGSGATHCHFWRGASGRRYAHAVYGLIDCPPLSRSTYLLVRRDAGGSRTVLHIGHADDDAPTLNLARIRQRGATLGANEVHVYGSAATDSERRLAVCDLRAGQFGALAAEPSHAA
jgi:hypothetical protein